MSVYFYISSDKITLDSKNNLGRQIF